MDQQKINICFFYESIGLGGQQTQMLNLIKHLNRMRHNIIWIYLKGTELESAVNIYASTIRIPVLLSSKDYIRNPWRLFSIGRNLYDLCQKKKVQILITGSGIGSLIGGIVSRVLGIPHYRLLGCSLIQVEKTLYKFYKTIQIDRIIDGYFGWPGVFNELSAKGVPNHKFIKLTPAVDSEMFYPFTEEKRDKIRVQLGIKPETIVIGWIGRISENMQVGNTVELAKILKNNGFKDFKLLFIGGGPWMNELKKKLKKYKLYKYSIMTGWVAYDQVNGFINAMDIIPLLEADPHGGSIIREAMSCGKLTISVDGPSGVQKDFMKPDATILVKEDNFIKKAAEIVISISKDSEKFEILCKNARLYAEKEMSFKAQAKIISDTLQQKIKY